VHSRVEGFVALLHEDSGARLIVTLGGGDLTDDPGTTLRALHEAEGANAPIDPIALERAHAAVRQWRSRRRDQRDFTLDGALHARSRRVVVDRIATIARRAPRHLRPGLVALAATARHAVTARYGVGAEHVLDTLAAADMPDEAWLRAISAFGAIHDRVPGPGTQGDADHGPAALLLLVALPPAEP
jgi:hypothetical protein